MDLSKININGQPWEKYLEKQVPPGLVEYAEFWKMWMRDPDHLVVQTSGSTGPPKLISHSVESLVESAKRTARFFQIPSGISCLVALPVGFIAGKMMLIRAAVNGWNIEWIEPSMHPTLPENPIQFAAFTPPQAAFLIENDRERFFSIDTVILGGGAVSEALELELRNAPNAIWATYGMAETITHVAARRISGAKFSTNYTGLPDVTFGIDERKCLTISAPYLDQMISTNDVVELHSEREFTWLGRADNIINSGGLKLFPEELERKIADLLPVPFYLSSEPDSFLGERLVLYVENYTQDEQALLAAIRAKVGPARAPKRVFNVEVFRRTESGKIIRRT